MILRIIMRLDVYIKKFHDIYCYYVVLVGCALPFVPFPALVDLPPFFFLDEEIMIVTIRAKANIPVVIPSTVVVVFFPVFPTFPDIL